MDTLQPLGIFMSSNHLASVVEGFNAYGLQTITLPIDRMSRSASVQQIAFIDAALPDYQSLVTGLKPGTVAYVLDPTRDELSQMTQVLAGYRDLQAVSIFSHGSNGALQLGNASLNASNLMDFAGVLQSWSGALSSDGDLLLYSCDVAEGSVGQAFVRQLASLTGADVAASTDRTGSNVLGGNWMLEFSTGSIEAGMPLSAGVQGSYAGILGLFDNPPINYNVGNQPYSVAIGDFNGDGKADIVMANRYSTTVSVLLNNGSGGFGTPTTYNVGNSPTSMAIGDFNGDGKADLVTTNWDSDTISVLLNNGSGGFGAQTTYSVGDYPHSVAVRDFNGDGKADLVSANYGSNTISVLLNNGSGGFGAQTTYSVGGDPLSVAVGDFNGDGKADLVSANSYSSNVSVLLNNGNGGFGTPTTYNVGRGPFSVAIGDFNGDGKADLVTANSSSGNVSVLLNNGSGGFRTQTTYSVGSYPRFVAVGDFNGDGKADLVTANSSSGNVSVLLNNGSGGFGMQTSYSVGGNPYSVAIGDFNGDGKADLVTANLYSRSISVLLNTNNLPPVVKADTGTAIEAGGLNNSTSGISAQGNVLSNDTPTPGSTLTVSAVAFGNTAGTVNNGLNGAYGSLTLKSDGSYTYAVDNTNPIVQARTNGSTLQETFTYSAKDSRSGLTSSSTLSITISGTNDAPVVTLLRTSETVLSRTILISDISIADIDGSLPGQMETVMLQVGQGSLSIANPNGATISGSGSTNLTLRGTIDQLNNALRTLNYSGNGFAGSTDLNVIANDGQYNSTLQKITLQVYAQPRTNADTGTAIEAGGLRNNIAAISAEGNVLSNDSNPNPGNDFRVSAVALGNTTAVNNFGSFFLAGAYGSLTLGVDGSYKYSAYNSSNIVQALNFGQTLTETFTYTAKDYVSGLTSSNTLTIKILGRNDAPTTTIAETRQTVSPGVVSSIAGIRVSDVDGPSFNNQERVTLTVSDGNLNLTNLSGTTIVSGQLNSNSFTMSGTIDQLNAALGNLTYNSGSFIGYARLQVFANDGQFNAETQSLFLNVNNAPTVPGAVAAWRFNEISGTVAADSTGRNNGTYIGNPSLTAGKFGNAATFNGSSNYIEVPNDPSLNFGTGNFSISTWIKTTDTNLSVIVDKRQEAAGPTQGYVLFTQSGNLGFQLAEGQNGYTNYFSPIAIADGQWHLVTVTIDRANPTGGIWYIDGVKQAATFNPTDRQGSLNNSQPLRIGRRSDSSNPGFLTGSLDEVQLFNKALSAEEVMALYKG